MNSVLSHIVLFFIALTFVSSATILDLFNWDTGVSTSAEKRDADYSPALRTCDCNGPTCMCCVDFNITYIDLGGPGCVSMRYISQHDGVAVNVSYGESLLHSEKVQGPHPEPTCISLLANLAQVCARFPDLQHHNEGLRGCLLLEPKLLGDVTSTFNIGCFTMGPEGMNLEEGTNSTLLVPNETSNQTQSESEGLNEEELIAAVNESAEQGLAFFGNLLGLTFGTSDSNANATEAHAPANTTA